MPEKNTENKTNQVYAVLVVGSGPAGLTAAIYTSRARLQTVVIGGLEYGGQLMSTTLVENYPGFSKGIMGPQLMNEMLEQAKRFGAEFVQDTVVDVNLKGKIKSVKTEMGKEFSAKTVILAQGSSPRRLGLPSEDKFYGRGVSTCAVCDAAFYKEKVAAVVGGGDSAVEDATALAKFAKKVYVIHRREELRASQIMQERLLNNEKVEVLWNTEVREVLGDDKVTGLLLANNRTDEESQIVVDGMFLAIGHIPNTQFLEGKIKLDPQKYIVVKDDVYTDIPGVFVAGDVADHIYQQAVTAAGAGCKAALMTEKYLMEH